MSIPSVSAQDIARVIGLSIKSLEQQTKFVSLPRNSTVLELKDKIQLVFDIEGTRQRLIFQGKVLKDNKNLLDYENLDDGKVIHLVVRPIDAPHNPDNDEPTRTTANNRPVSTRQISEGYAVITLDASMADLSDGNSFLSSIMGSLLPPSDNSNNSPFSPRQAPRSQGFFQALRGAAASGGSIGSIFNRSSFDFFRQGRRPPNVDGLLDIIERASQSSITLPVPSSVEMRLSRTLSYVREIRTLLDSPVLETDINRSNQTRHSSLRAIRESRELLRREGDNQAAQVGLVLEELADLMMSLSPWLRDMGRSLRTDDNGRTSSQQLAHVLRTARIVQILSLIHHFLASVLSSEETETTPPPPPPPPAPASSTTTEEGEVPPPVTQQPKRKHRDDGDNNGSSGSSGTPLSSKKTRCNGDTQ